MKVLAGLISAAAVKGASGAAHIAGAACGCVYVGQQLPAATIDGFPNKDPADCTPGADNTAGDCTSWPGMYKNEKATKYYGTSCAAWDFVADTPWKGSCAASENFGTKGKNWCQQPWCYVDKDCANGVASSVFKGSDIAFYSYLSCGNKGDCYTGVTEDTAWPTGCPFDPYGDSSYTVFKKGNCACKYAGGKIPADIYTNFPEKKPADCEGDACTNFPGQYKDKAAISYYGTTCAAWDSMPDTPWYSYCPAGSDWCNYDYNWCMEPWCYVDSACSTGVASTVFKGSTIARYSYDTCIGTPDCYTDIAWADSPKSVTGCPYDYTFAPASTVNANSYWTQATCANGWSKGSTTGAADDAVSTGLQAMVMAVVALFHLF